MKIGSLFSGIGGLDLACEAMLSGTTVWQVELEPFACEVLRRHWGDIVIEQDVTTVDTSELEDIDCLLAGWPCQDLSIAGKRAGLDGEKSGLYSQVLRFTRDLSPSLVVGENVPNVLKYKDRIAKDFHALGYGTRFVPISASQAGAPQLRRRVFIVAYKGWTGSEVVGNWGPREPHLWPTPCASGDRTTMFQQGGEPLGHALRRPVRGCEDALPGVANPDFVDALQGFPVGWSNPEGVSNLFLAGVFAQGLVWPAARPLAQGEWEPTRLVEARSVKNRAARLKAMGNAVVPAQARAAIARAMEAKGVQQGLFEEA